MPPGRLAKRARCGEYVLAHKWSDCDPQDPWRVGFVCQVVETWNPQSSQNRFEYVIGEQNGQTTDLRPYSYCRRITAEEGREWIALHGVS